MPYTTPKTWASGDVLTAADLNTYVRDNVAFNANPPKCRVFNSAAISAANAVDVLVTLDSERFDTDTMHSTTTNPERITFTTAGTYLVGASLAWSDNAAGSRVIYIRRNGVNRIVQQSTTGTGVANNPIAASTLFYFAANDYVELFAFQNSGSVLTIAALTENSPEFWAVRVSA